jgi:hypothetical protein
MRKALHWLSFALTWTVRLVPAVALFSAFFALEGAGLPGCACAARGRPAVSAWPCF